MFQSQRRKLAAIFFIQIFLIPTSLAACPTIFYAKQIDYDELKKIDFYHTQLNVQTASECANVCAKKQFCRLAVYNHEAKTCASSFDVKIDCIKSRQRFNDFFLSSTSSTTLSIISCIDRCKKGEAQKPLDFVHEKSGEEIEKPEKKYEHSPKFSVHFTTPKDSESNKMDSITLSPSDETFTPQPIVITEDDLKNANKTVKMIPQPLNFENIEKGFSSSSATASDGSHNNINEVVRKIENFTVTKKNGGTVFTGKVPKHLITISPEEFEKIVGSDNSLLKTVNTTGKIKVQGEDIEKIIESVKHQIESNQKVLVTKDKDGKSDTNTNSVNDNNIPSKESEAEEFSTKSPFKTTTTEPIVINGKVLSPDAVSKLFEYERTSTTTTTTPRPIVLTTEEGFMNTFVISGVGDAFKEALADRNNQGQGHLSPELSTGSTSIGPSSCYRTIYQQLLYRAAFEKLGGRVSLNECRCACAKTWENSEIKPKCKSLQYNEITGECSLNQDNHTGKFDLISHKDIDYHYISCELGLLLDLKDRMCGSKSTTTPLTKTDTKEENRIDITETNTQVSTSSNPPTEESATIPLTYKGDETQIVKDEIPDPSLTVAEMDSLKNKHGNIKSKKSETNVTEKVDVMFSASTTPFSPTEDKTTIIPITLPSVERTTIKEKVILVTAAEITTEKSPSTTKKANKKTTSKADTTTVSSTETTATIPSTTSESTTTTTTTQLPTTTTTAVTSALNKNKTERCYETFDGYRLTTKPGGLESDVTLEECFCFCANSRTSNRYQFQCLSALYYHKEKDCMLFIDNRQLKPESFTLAPASDGNVTYLGMICPLSKTIETHVNPSYDFGCVKPETSTTPSIRTTTTAVHTDDCFNEHPKYVLEGTSLAIESNVTVEECKCYCIDSESRYGSDCQSIQYYYDSQTCLLNKENQITDPENFVYDPYSDQMRSYFDYTCRSERMVLSVYVEQICSTVVEIDLKKLDIGPPSIMPIDNSAPNNDEKSTEIKKEHDTSKEVEDDEKTSTSTTPTTTTTPATTTSTTTTEPPPTSTTQIFSKNSNKPIKYKSKAAEIEELSGEIDEPTTISTTTQIPTTTTTTYKLVKYCERSALYQTVFNGDKLIKKLTVTNADECLSACYAEKCRSANLVHISGVLKNCELYKDSIVDFRRTDVISFDPGAVYFDAIKCYE
uniref:Apple domain-containing protein n=1 Tax=Panagrolaimus sp. PS1159 TaxID=55785 RepID=A0AC35EU63_9BILA